MTTYTSTRGGTHGRSFEDVLLRGLAEDGGLFVPETWSALKLEAMAGLAIPRPWPGCSPLHHGLL
ncbi:MAG: hypothetical protein R3C69_09390 [Geminicoccaceae bacterium]